LMLPVRVNVHCTASYCVTVGALHDADTPLGRPETTVAWEPGAPAATDTPPTGDAWTMKFFELMDCMVRLEIQTCEVTPGAVAQAGKDTVKSASANAGKIRFAKLRTLDFGLVRRRRTSWEKIAERKESLLK
jgi:hypothetical protein